MAASTPRFAIYASFLALTTPWVCPAGTLPEEERPTWAHQALRWTLQDLPDKARTAAGLKILRQCTRADEQAALKLLHDSSVDVSDCFALWADEDFEAALVRAEELDGLTGNLCRKGAFRSLALRDPVAAAREMRLRLNPLSLQYYYYVTIQGLVPALKKQPASVVLKALPEITAYDYGLDSFRWGDAMSELASENGGPWTPPDRQADWEYLNTQPVSFVRECVRAAVVCSALGQDLGRWIGTDVSQIDEGAWHSVNGSIRWPGDPAQALARLPMANRDLMHLWVKDLVVHKAAPDWQSWASTILNLPADSPWRAQALDTFLHVWLQVDPTAARTWAEALPAGAARDTSRLTLAEQTVLDQVKNPFQENFNRAAWKPAFDQACALPEGARRARALRAVFLAAGHLDATAAEKALTQAAGGGNVPDNWRDAWTLGRRYHAETAAAERLALVRSLRNACTRRDELCTLLIMDLPRDQWRALVSQAALPEPEREELLQLIEADERHFQSAHAPGHNPVKTLNETLRIKNPEIRFMRQRSIIHNLLMAHEKDDEGDFEAQTLVTGSALDSAAQVRLLEECKRMNGWRKVKP